MAFYIGTQEVTAVPAGSDATRGAELMADGEGSAFWGYMGGGSLGIGQVDNNAWRYRSIYTHGYLAAGYKGSNPWRSVNKTWHLTDTTLYCGEQLSFTQAYTDGNYSDFYGYIVSGGGFSGATANISSYSLATEVYVCLLLMDFHLVVLVMDT